MAAKDNLFRLIKSLSRGEKRSFKLFASQYSKSSKNIYVRLFDAIDAQVEYNEELLIRKFHNEKFIKQLAVTKNYLFNIILKSLRNYQSDEAIGFKINEGVESATILFQRGLYRQASKTIKKTKSYAWQCQKFELLLNMLHLEKEILYRYLNVQKYQEYQEVHKEEYSRILTIINNREEFQTLFDSIFFLYRKFGRPRSKEERQKYDKIINHPLLSDIAHARSLRAVCYFNVIHAVYQAMTGFINKSYEYVFAEIEAIEQSELLTLSHMDRYISALNNALHIQVEKKDIPEIEKTLSKIRALPSRFPHMGLQSERRIFESTYQLELSFYFNTRNFEKGLSLIDEVKEGLKRFRDLGGSLDIRLNIMYDIARLYFFSGDLNNAHNWIDSIIEKEKTNIALFIISYAKIIDLMIHYQLNNYSLLEYKIKSTKRYLTKNNRLFNVENLFLKFLSKVINIFDEKDKKKEFEKLKADFEALSDDDYKDSAQENLLLPQWIESQVSKVPIQKVIVSYEKIAAES